MCAHENYQTIEEGVSEERWEGDFYTQDIWDWVVCQDCGDDFACKAA